MKRFLFALLITVITASPASAQGPEPQETILAAVVPSEVDSDPTEETGTPVPAPPLNHYSALWQRSMFTTNEMPTPEAPQGPGFADQLALAGVYEVDGAMIAVILDKMTAQIMEARIGSDNEYGIRVKNVEMGAAGASRVQLQKGLQSGWIAFADASGSPSPPTNPAPNGVATRSLGAMSSPTPSLVPPTPPPANLAPPPKMVIPAPVDDDLPLPPD